MLTMIKYERKHKHILCIVNTFLRAFIKSEQSFCERRGSLYIYIICFVV